MFLGLKWNLMLAEGALTKLLKIWFPPFSFVILLATLALLTNHQALEVYTSLFSLLSIDPQWVSHNSTHISNVGHVVGFFFLAVLCRISTPLRFWQIALLCIVLATSIELTQKLITYRQGRWDDLLFGTTGTFVGLWVVSFKGPERGTRDEWRENLVVKGFICRWFSQIDADKAKPYFWVESNSDQFLCSLFYQRSSA